MSADGHDEQRRWSAERQARPVAQPEELPGGRRGGRRRRQRQEVRDDGGSGGRGGGGRRRSAADGKSRGENDVHVEAGVYVSET